METVGTFSQPFFEWLLRSTLQASIVVCLILLIQVTVRNRLTARWHYALWLILVVRMVLPWAPQSRFSIYNLASWQRKPAAPAHVTPEQDAEPPTASRQLADTQRTPAGSKLADTAEGQGRTTPDPVATSRETTGPAARAGFALVSLLQLIWLGGMLFLGGYIIISNLRLWRAASVECPSTDRDTLELLEECRTTIGLRAIVALVPSKTVNTPVLLGFVRPRLLIPKNITNKLTREELRYVFLHELAHVKRHDIALGWLTTLLQVLHWFNPLVWLAFHRMRSNRESACDALVLSRTQGEAAQDYGLSIVSLLEHFSVPQALPGLAGILESKSQLKRRIAMITQFDNKSYRWSPLAAVLIVILACISLPNGTRTKASEPFDPASAITIRQVWKGQQTGGTWAVSPNGQCLAFGGYATGDLAIRELATGADRRITKTGGWREGSYVGVLPGCMAFSPDGKQIAYNWVNQEKDVDLRIVDLDASEPRILCRGESGKITWPIAWSPNGKEILAALPDGQYGLVSVPDGLVRILESLTRDTIVGEAACFSPDGRYIVCSSPQEKGPSKADISLFALETGAHSRLIEHPANDILLGWTPDGSSVLFASDRRGTLDAWLVQVADGKRQGEPRLIKADLGQIIPLGFTQNGSFYYRISSLQADVYVATLDLKTGSVVEPPKKVSLRREGLSSSPDWSADGKYLAYISQRFGSIPDHATIVIHNVETGEYRELSTSLRNIRLKGARWSPDGRSFILYGFKGTSGSAGIYRVDAKTGQESLIRKVRAGQPEWTPDGKGIVFMQGDNSGTNRIMLRDLETGQERELAVASRGEMEQMFALSPDGRRLAFTTVRKDTESVVLNVVPVAGGEPRELTRVKLPEKIGRLEWVPDGSQVLFEKQVKEGTALWRVPVEGGAAQASGLIAKGYGGVAGGYLFPRMHPDGRRIAFTGSSPMVGEVWAMENFLPKGEAEN